MIVIINSYLRKLLPCHVLLQTFCFDFSFSSFTWLKKFTQSNIIIKSLLFQEGFRWIILLFLNKSIALRILIMIIKNTFFENAKKNIIFKPTPNVCIRSYFVTNEKKSKVFNFVSTPKNKKIELAINNKRWKKLREKICRYSFATLQGNAKK